MVASAQMTFDGERSGGTMLGIAWWALGCGVTGMMEGEPAEVVKAPEPQSAPAQGVVTHSRLQVETLDGAAPTAVDSGPTFLDIALGLLKTFEGWVPTPYDDPAGYCTVGHGHLIALDTCANVLPKDGFEEGKAITDTMGETILKRDLGKATAAVSELVNEEVELEDHEFSALTSFAFNVGRDNLAGSTLLRVLNEGDREAAAKEFPRWVMAGGKTLDGLRRRRSCEQTLFKDELVPGTDGAFDRTSCETLGVASEGVPLIDLDVGETVPQ